MRCECLQVRNDASWSGELAARGTGAARGAKGMEGRRRRQPSPAGRHLGTARVAPHLQPGRPPDTRIVA